MTSPRRSRVWVLLATLIAVAIAVRLSVWQLDRAAQKVAMQTALDARSGLAPITADDLAADVAQATQQHYRPVRLRGRWLADRTVFLENRQMNGRVGFYVVTPLLLADPADVVLVQRGWAPRDQLDRTRLPDVLTPAGVVEVQGLIAPPPARLYEFQGSASGTIRQPTRSTAIGAANRWKICSSASPLPWPPTPNLTAPMPARWAPPMAAI